MRKITSCRGVGLNLLAGFMELRVASKSTARDEHSTRILSTGWSLHDELGVREAEDALDVQSLRPWPR